MRKILTLMVAASVMTALASCGTSQPEPQNAVAREAVVDDFMGTVTATSDGEATPAFKGLALLRNHLLATESESWASLELNDGQFVMIEENTTIEISKLSDDLKNTEITLTEGNLWVSLTNKLSDDESFEVSTPSCGMSVRGTVFFVSCDKEGSGRIAVYEGTVSLQAGDKSYEISDKAVEITAENGVVKDVLTPMLAYDDAVPFYIRGTTGPGGVFGVLRDRLPRLTWDSDYPPVGGPTYMPIGILPDGKDEQPSSGAESGENGEPSQLPTSMPSQSPSPTPSPEPTQSPTQAPSPSTSTPTATSSPSPTPTTSAPTPTPTPTTTSPTTTPAPDAVPPKISIDSQIYRFEQGSGDSVPFTCTGSAPITFDVQAKNSEGTPYPYFGIDRNTNTGYNYINIPAWLSPDTYYLTIRAENSAGWSSVTFTVVLTPALAAPIVHFNVSEARVVQGNPVTVGYSLSGGDPDNITAIATDSLGYAFIGFTINTSSQTLTIPGVLGAEIYTVTITAENSTGKSSDSFTLTVEAPASSVPDYPEGTWPDRPIGTGPDDPGQTQPDDPGQTQPNDPGKTEPDDPGKTGPNDPTGPRG